MCVVAITTVGEPEAFDVAVSPAVNSMDPNMPDPPCHKIDGVCANNILPMYRYDVCG